MERQFSQEEAAEICKELKSYLEAGKVVFASPQFDDLIERILQIRDEKGKVGTVDMNTVTDLTLREMRLICKSVAFGAVQSASS